MGILNSEMKYSIVNQDLSQCCLSEANCGGCDKEKCIIGFARQCAQECQREGITYVDGGSDRIPFDTKIYNEDSLVEGIAHILKQCRSCDTEHFDNCIINIIRNCYEIGLFGEVLAYKGSAFQYLNQIHSSKPDVAGQIIEAYHNSDDSSWE